MPFSRAIIPRAITGTTAAVLGLLQSQGVDGDYRAFEVCDKDPTTGMASPVSSKDLKIGSTRYRFWESQVGRMERANQVRDMINTCAQEVVLRIVEGVSRLSDAAFNVTPPILTWDGGDRDHAPCRPPMEIVRFARQTQINITMALQAEQQAFEGCLEEPKVPEHSDIDWSMLGFGAFCLLIPFVVWIFLFCTRDTSGRINGDNGQRAIGSSSDERNENVVELESDTDSERGDVDHVVLSEQVSGDETPDEDSSSFSDSVEVWCPDVEESSSGSASSFSSSS